MFAWFHLVVVALTARPRNERGLSQSTENALLVAGAVAVALLIVSVVTAFVSGRLDVLR